MTTSFSRKPFANESSSRRTRQKAQGDKATRRQRKVFFEQLEDRRVMATLNASLDGLGQLLITDATSQNNDLTISASGANLVITDSVEAFTGTGGIAGAVLSNADRTLTIPVASITGGQVIVNGGNGNDTLTVNLAPGNAIPANGITFNGGGPLTNPGDKLNIIGGTPGSVTYNYTNASDGSVVLSAYGTVNYTGLEPVLVDSDVSPTDVTFNLPAGAGVAILEDDTAATVGQLQLRAVSGSAFETTSFTVPTGNLIINATDGDTLQIAASQATDLAAAAGLSFAGNGVGANVMQLNAANILPNLLDVTVNAATFDLASFSETIDGLNGTGTVQTTGGTPTLTVGAGNAATADFSGVLQNGTGTLGFTKTGTGTQTLSGGVSNSHTGTTTLDNGILFFSKTGGAVAVAGLLNLGGGNANQPYLRMGQPNQFAASAVVNTINVQNNWVRFDLLGNNQTLTNISDTVGGLVLQNSGLGLPVATNATITINNTANLTLRSHIRNADSSGAGTLGLTKQGSGILTLRNLPSGAPRVTYTGPTLVSSGELILMDLGDGTPTNSYKSPTTIETGTTLRTQGASTVQTPGGTSLTFNGGTYSHEQSQWFVWSGAWNINTNSVVNVVNSGASNQVFVDGGINGPNRTLTINNTGTATTGVHFRNGGLGNYSGSLVVNNGQIAIGNAAPLWFANTDLTLNSATLQLGNAAFAMSASGAQLKSLNGNGTVTAAGSNTTLTLGTNNGSGTFTGSLISGAGGTLNLMKTGTGTQSLTGTAHNYTGTTTVSGGVLEVTHATALGNSTAATVLTNSATLRINGNITTAEPVSLAGDGIIANNTAGSLVTMTGNITTNNYSLQTSGAGDLTINGNLIGAPTNYNSQVLANSPVAYWRLDESSGANPAVDVIGGRNGAYTNFDSWAFQHGGALTDNSNAAVQFDGVNDIITVPSDAGLNTLIGGDYTIQFWMYKDAEAGDWQRLVGKGNGAGRQTGVWEEAGAGKRLLFQIYNNVGGVPINMMSTSTIEIGQWYHVAAVKQGSTASIYINGTLDSSVTAAPFTPQTVGNDPLTFGKLPTEHTFFPGRLDEIAIFGSALSGSTISQLSVAGGATGNVTKLGTGTLTLGGTNTHVGSVSVQAGMLVAANSSALGTAAQGTTVFPGATLGLSGGITISNEDIVLQGSGVAGQPGALVNLYGNNSIDAASTVVAMGGVGSALTIGSTNDGGTAFVDTLTIDAPINLQTSNLVFNGTGNVSVTSTISSSMAAPTLATLDNFATGNYNLLASGDSIPVRIVNDGSDSWLLIGRGRQGWQFDTDGQRRAEEVNGFLGTIGAFGPAAFSDALVNELLAQAGITNTNVEIRLRRATDVAGTTYQESRWRNFTNPSFTFDFNLNGTPTVDDADGYPVLYQIVSGTGAPFTDNDSNTNDTLTTPNADSGNDATRVFTWPWAGHGNQQGFSYGGSVQGVDNNSQTSFLWEAANEGHAIPYTEVYIRSLTTNVVAPTANTLTKQGTGTVNLTGTSSYTGATTVTAGTLLVNGSISGSPVTVQSGGTLGGTGTTGPLTINSGGTHSPGNSPGITTVVGNYIENGLLVAEIGTPSGSVPGVDYDQVQVTAGGSVTIGGTATLNVPYLGVAGTFAPAFAQVYTVIDNDGATQADTTGTFTGLAEGALVTVDGRPLRIYYHGGDGNNVVLVSANNPNGNTLYVDDSFTAPGPVDGDLEAAGVQTAYVGVNAFASVADLLTAYPAFAGTVILNGGTYANVNLAGGGAITLQLVRDLTAATPDVTIQNLAGDATDAIVTRFYNVSGGNLTVEQGSFAGLISGAGSLTKNTAGTFTLTSAVANTYAGGTTVNGGILSLGTGGVGPNTSHQGALGAGAVTVNSGAQVRLWIQNASSFTVSNAFNLNGGTIHDEDGTYNLTGVVTLGTGGGTLSAKWNNKTLTVSGQITGTTGLTIANANGAGDGGSTVILSNNANNYAGGTTINNLLRLGAANVIPNGAAAGNVTIAGTLDLRGFAETINGLIAASATASVTSGVAGAVTLTVGDNNATGNTFNGVISNGSGTVSLTKIGTGTQTLSNKNTYTGGTLVSAGTLSLTSTANNGFSTVGTGDLTISSGATVIAQSGDNQLGSGVAANIPNVIINGGTFTASSPFAGGMWFKGITMTAGTLNGTTGLNPQTSVGSSLTTLASATTATVSAPISNSHSNFIITVANGAAANDLTLSSAVSGAAATGITKSGPGLLHQTGNLHNFAGTLTVNGGTWNTGGTNLFTPNHGTGKQNTFQMIVDGATWTNTSGVVNRIGNVTLRNAATWSLTGVSNDWGTYFVGPLSDSSQPTITVDGVGASIINGNGNLRLGVTPTFNVADVTSSAATDLTVDVELENQTNAQGFAAANVIKSGTGTMLFSAPNTYTGTTAVNAGVLSLTGGAAIANAAGAVSVANLATLQLLASETISSYVGADDGANENDSLLAIAGFTLTTTGNATIANVTSANGSIVAGGSILDGDADNNLSGSGIFLQAGASVGAAANPLEATITNLEGNGGTGFFVANIGNLTIGGVTAANGVISGGDVVVSAAGSLTVNENVAAAGAGSDVTLSTIDALGGGQDLNVATGVIISSAAATVTLNAGDNATIPLGSRLTAAGNVTVQVDAGNADGGLAGSLSFAGDVDALLAIFNGTTDSVGDSFNTIRPDQDVGDMLTPIQVFGFDPPANPNGDTLVLDITGLGIPTLTLGPGPRNGSFSFGALAAPLTYNNIENVSTSPALPYHLVLDMRFSGFENGAADTILAQLDATGTNLILDVNAGNVFTGLDNVIQSLTIIGSNDNDALTIQETAGGLPKFLGGAPVVNNTGIGGGVSAGSHLNSSADLTLETLRGVDTPWDGNDVTIHFDGGAAGTDSLTVNYTTLNNTGYFSDTSDAGNSGNLLSAPGAFPVIGVPTLVLSFANLEPLTVSGAGGALLADATGTAATANLTITNLGANSQITGDGGFAATTFSGYSNVAVIGGGGAELIDVVSINSAVLTSLNLLGGNTNNLLGLPGGDIADDTLRVRSLPATATATLQGNAGSDLFQLYDASNTVDNIAGPVIIDGNDGNVGGNTDTLTIIDSGDLSGDSNVVISAVSAGSSQDYAVEGITSTLGNDVVLRNIDVLNYTSTADNDQIDGRFESTVPAHDLNTVNLSGWTGADQFLLFTSDQIGGSGAFNTPTGTPSGVANINLFGDALGNPNAGDISDRFGLTPAGVTGTGAMNVGLVVADSTRMIRPSASTSIAINGGTPTGLAAPLGDVAGDVLNLDISALPNTTPVIVSTFGPGTVAATGIQPLTWVEIEDINLVDQGKLTNVQMGDLFARTTPGQDLVQITRNPTALNPNQVRLRITSTIGNYSASNKTIIYAGGMNDTLTQANLTIPAEFYGEGGDDYISGATNNDWLVGGEGNDRINGSQGDNVIWGDNAPTLPTDPQPQDLVAGGDDQLSGLSGNDVFYGGGGNDSVSAGGGNDYAYGGEGNDTLDGNDGDDRLYGGAGNDIIGGHSGGDLLSGGAGNDKLYGDSGNDVLFGGTGADLLDAGAGNDLLVSGSVAGESSSWTSVASTSTYNAATYTLPSDNDAALLTLLAQWATLGNRGSLGTSPAITHDGANDDLFGSAGDDDFCWETADVIEHIPGTSPPDYNALGLGMDERFGPT